MRISDIRDDQLTEMASFRYYINKVTDDREKDDTEIQYFGQQRAQIPTTTVIAQDGKLTTASTFTVITTRPAAGDRLATQTLMKARELPTEQQPSFAQSAEGMFLGVWRGLKGGTPYHEMEPLLDAYPQVFKVVRNVSRAKLYQMLLTMGMQRYTFEKNYGAAPEEEQAAEHGERLHNAVIFFPDQMRPARKDMIRKFLSTAHDILSKNGMEMLFGGNITFTDLGRRTGGDWQQSTKQMRINPNTKSSTANTYTLLHEYGHKYWWNFMTEEAQYAVREKYNELSRSGVRHKTDWSKLRAVYDAAEGVIEVGTQAEWVGRASKFAGRWEVTRVNPSFDKRGFKTNSYLAHRLMVNEVDTSGPSIYGPVAALLDKKKWKLLNVNGSDALPDLNDANIEKSDMATDQWFPTNYSMSKATEWWAEMFAFTMLGNLHGEPAAFMDQVLGRGGVTESRLDELVDVQTPAFQQWFTGSKVVDNRGRPQMLYHGTRSNVEFQELRGGSHFGTLGAAGEVTDITGGDRPRTGGARIYPVYLNIKDPVEMWDSKSSHGDAPDQYVTDILAQAEFNSDWDLMKKLEAWVAEIEWDSIPDEQKLPNLMDYLSSLGYDGITYENRHEDKGSQSWIPFSKDQVKYAYAESGTVIKNVCKVVEPPPYHGRPTPLTKMQSINELADIDSPEFRQWFGKSKVVHPQYGKPMMVFHGTQAEKEFGKLRAFSHFGTQLATQHFTAQSGYAIKGKSNARVYPVYLRIENPAPMIDSGESHNATEIAYGVYSGFLAKGYSEEASRMKMLTNSWLGEGLKEHQKLLQVIKFLQKQGFDGIAYKNIEEDPGSISWIPFSQSQIKYAYAESVNEGVDLLPQKIYHGTVGTDKAEKILQQGVRAQRIMNPKTHLAPVAGRVYAAQNLGYAMMYAMGGAMAGFEMPNVPEEDPYGYLFVIDKSEVLDDILPDEDNVGEAWMYAEMVNNGKLDTLKEFYFEDPVARAIAFDEAFRNQVYYLGTNVASERTLKFVKGGEYMWFAKLGKMMLKQMGPKMKELFLSAGGNVSVQGPLTPSEVWRIDRRHTKELKKDGSNFFQVAERIR